jgi:predicted nucleotidyltransferase
MLTIHQHYCDVLADVFRMRAFVDIWGFIVRSRFNKPFYIRELVNEAKVDPRVAYTWVKDNARNGIIHGDVQAGRTKFYRLNFDNMLTQKVVELLLAAESEAMQKGDEFFAAIVQAIRDESVIATTGEGRILLAVLYGSQARKTASKGSDVDLFFVIQDEKGEGKRRVRELCDMMSDRYSRRVEPVIVAEKQFAKMLKEPEDFIINVMRDGVPLYGLEYYVICRSSAKAL